MTSMAALISSAIYIVLEMNLSDAILELRLWIQKFMKKRQLSGSNTHDFLESVFVERKTG